MRWGRELNDELLPSYGFREGVQHGRLQLGEDVNVAGAADLVLDYERRLQAEDSGKPSVMMLCLGERVQQ